MAAEPPLRVTVTNGDLTFETEPLLIGHYRSTRLTGSERVMDTLLGGNMGHSLAVGMYPQTVGGHQIFINLRSDLERRGVLPRPKAVIVVGLGLNVTMTAEESPDPRATSLTQLGTATTDRAPLARALLRHLDARITGWRNDDPSLAADYRARSVTIGNRVRAILPGDTTLVGAAADVDELGRLIIDTATERVTLSAGDITHLRPEES